MTIAMTDEHRHLAEVAASFAAAHQVSRQTRAALEEVPQAPAECWAAAADLGWTGLHLPVDVGGAGYGLFEVAVIADELGAGLAPGPLVDAFVGAAVVDRLGTADLRAALLPRLATGSQLAVFGAAGDDCRCTVDGIARGRTAPIAGAAFADQVALVVGDDVVVLATDQAGVSRRFCPDALDPALGLAAFDLDDTAGVLLPGAARDALALARTLIAAHAAGGARAVLRLAVEYAKVREQFGRPIGSFQAVKHLLANGLVATESATAAAWDAAEANTSGRPGAQGQLAAATAAAVAVRAYQESAQLCIQIHGGIGFTWEHDAHLYLRRAATLAGLYPASGASADVSRLSRAGVRRELRLDLPAEADEYRAAARRARAALDSTPEPLRRRQLVESGYLVPHWPRPWGRGAAAAEQLVIDEEFAGVEMPSLGIGGWILLTLTRHATAAQIERWIPPSLDGDLVWCQLFSEPEAGSDAAAIRTRGIRVEGGWRVSGQKVWTSGAHECDLGLATVRTNPDAPKHHGITAMVIDLHAPGVEVRPLREITGDAMFNEVFLDDVFVPDDSVVGEIDDGWTVARATLGNERVSIGATALGATTATDLIALADRYQPGDEGLVGELGDLVITETLLAVINLRQAARAVAGGEIAGSGAVTKLLVSAFAQSLSETAMRIVGPAGVAGFEPDLAREYLAARALTIAGGTSQIARNVIAERLLGLPREPGLR